MSELMQRKEIATALEDMGVEFPPTATLTQLRGLLATTVGATAQGDANQTAKSPAMQDANRTVNNGQTQRNSAAATADKQREIVRAEVGESAVEERQSPISTAAFGSDKREAIAAVMCGQRGVTTEAAAANAGADHAVHRNRSDDDSELTAMEERLEKRLRILQLEAEINKLGAGRVNRTLPMNLSEIEKTLPNFSGDNKINVEKWIAEFDDTTSAYACNEESRMIIARRLLTGSAQIVLRISRINTWAELKAGLISEFKKPLSVKDVFHQLETRVWEKSETLGHYVLSMQELAQSAPIGEHELVEFIIDGLRDKSTKTLVFSGVTTIEKLKKLIPQYERLLMASYNKRSPSIASGGEVQVRCYNCSRYGHYSIDCKEKRRERGSCFKCGAKDHLFRNCPLKVVAAVEEDGDYKAVHFKEMPM
ncbi:uncharacterized protein LOC118734797 [Rhagoletis pomonella]|uniref:uncharacterized protein LOC118734797 n=1 Tax=Rhagoletis pomonella TaxID=28610 RepID=UPI00178473C4|nr:uncharacterized protein LOC118734797 [Rhagoletis pomonella]